MNYKPEARAEVMRQAYRGLYELVTPMLFFKYLDFIDVYAEVTESEREDIYQQMTEHMETAMLAQYIREKGFKEGIQQGIQKGLLLNSREAVIDVLEARFGVTPKSIVNKIKKN